MALLDLRDPRCEKCGEDRLLERVVTGGKVMIFCPVCAHSWMVAS